MFLLLQILRHTPTGVWFLLAGLVALGVAQARPRRVGLRRLTVLPLVLLAGSLTGVVSTFGPRSLPMAAWAAGVALALAVGRRALAPREAGWSPETATLQVAGSWLPLALILGMFSMRYASSVGLVLHPQLAADPLFAGGCSLAFGLFSGTFLGRAAALWEVARAAVRRPAVAPSLQS